MSFYTSLSGLQAAQTDMSTISHNLANVSTNGFKRSMTMFADVIASTKDSNPNQMVGSGTVVKAIRQQFSQGGYTQSSSSLDLAITGDGFFAVRNDTGTGGVMFTRNGSFTVDSERYVTDQQGNKLLVYPVDGSGAVVATGIDSAQSLRIPQTSGTPQATQNVALSLNLSANSTIPKEAGRFEDTPYAFDRFDPGTYNQSSQTTIYDAGGNALTLTNYYVRETAPTTGDATSTWSVYSFVGDQQLDADAATAGTQQITLEFDSTGKITAPTGTTAFSGFLSPGATSEQMLTLNFGTATTQVGQPFSVNTRSQDGAAVGQFESVTVGDDGIVRASFSNGDLQPLGKVMLANFTNPTGLRQLGNSTWAATGLSGEARLGEPNSNGFGSLMSGAVERSNVDITEELVGLIAAQRNFQANAKALDTASQISQTIFNIRS
ncbi:flagellar hook protein FlgE [Sphingomonas sp. G-3-2-10]|uniref:flagellar hook protein FlgE n=1 Tax=Sphingomonas sp. G-3-2-10 TaxID=2728838 RepID=UPI00146B797C|nr:flagellar hook protein FlgE [Sphingomonas sp. G-3-2-10]NML08136.1 flagellar hook protein FlgE [Sphingomonas sp. G-3-2-10]